MDDELAAFLSEVAEVEKQAAKVATTTSLLSSNDQSPLLLLPSACSLALLPSPASPPPGPDTAMLVPDST